MSVVDIHGGRATILTVTPVTSGGGLHGEGLVNGRDVRAGYGQGLVNSTIIDPLNGAMAINPYGPRGYHTQIPRMQPQSYGQSIGQTVGQVHGTVGTVVLPSGQIARACTGAHVSLKLI